MVKYLLVRSESGHIGFPKGHMEKGESEKDTALREIREETGIVLTDLDVSFSFTNEYPLKNGNQKHVRLFVSAYSAADCKFKAEQEVFECEFKKAVELLAYEADRQFLKQVAERVESYE